MTRFTKQIKIHASKQEVWKSLSNLGDIYKFNPNVTKSYYTSDQRSDIGASRICELGANGSVSEVATEWNEGESFTLRIDPIEKAPPLKDIYAFIDIADSDPGYVLVNCGMSYEPKLGIIGKILNSLVIKSKMQEAIVALLEGLKLHLEKGVEISDTIELQKYLKAA